MAITPDAIENEVATGGAPEVDSKYRLIILAAKRSKQLQRGASPRIEIDPNKHKVTRIALEEVIREVWQRIWAMSEKELGGQRAFLCDYEIYDQRSADPENAQIDVYVGLR